MYTKKNEGKDYILPFFNINILFLNTKQQKKHLFIKMNLCQEKYSLHVPVCVYKILHLIPSLNYHIDRVSKSASINVQCIRWYGMKEIRVTKQKHTLYNQHSFFLLIKSLFAFRSFLFSIFSFFVFFLYRVI